MDGGGKGGSKEKTVFPPVFLLYSHRNTTQHSDTRCVDLTHPKQFCNSSWVSSSLTQSDTIYLKQMSDPTGEGLRLLPTSEANCKK